MRWPTITEIKVWFGIAMVLLLTLIIMYTLSKRGQVTAEEMKPLEIGMNIFSFLVGSWAGWAFGSRNGSDKG
ncbi:MAG TPA: hypothetical protein VGH05_20855 [Buttiauxella sp.]|jgi:uncharacterized transporter YbjL